MSIEQKCQAVINKCKDGPDEYSPIEGWIWIEGLDPILDCIDPRKTINELIEQASAMECIASPVLYIREYKKWLMVTSALTRDHTS